MADSPDFTAGATPTLQQLATFLADEIFDKDRLVKLEHVMRNAHAYGATTANAAEVQAEPSLVGAMEKSYEITKDIAQRAMGAGLGFLVGEILGIEVSPAELFHARQNPEESAVGAAIADVAFKAIRGPAGELQPGDEGARRLLGTLAHIITHCWAEGIILEKVEHVFSTDGHIEAIATLAKDLVDTLGLNRAARTAIRPMIRAVISTPLEWKVNKEFRPNLLSEGEILKAFKRGTYTSAEAAEELARLGYSDKRQDQLLQSSYERLSLEDVLVLVRHGSLERDYAIQNLKDQGFDELTASYRVIAAESKRFDAIHDNSLSALVRGFVNRDLTDSEFRSFLPAIIPDELEQDSYVVAARTQRDLNVKHLSQSEVIDCVELGVLAVADYRHWLEREGYPPDEIFALELRLRVRLGKIQDVENERAAMKAERAAEKAARQAAAAERLAQVEADRALQRRGSIADLRRAAVRGQISFARLRDVLAPQYDADTVQIILDAVEADRLDYLAQLKAAEDAKRRAGVRNVDVGALETAVLEHVLTIQQFRARLTELLFSPADADLLAATLAAKVKDRDDAAAKRIAAEEAARRKSIDLGRFETLVRRGHRTMADYAALLASLGFDDASRAAMLDLLQLQIEDDAAARRIRDDAAAKRQAVGLSLDQFRRAVILGIRTRDAFQTYLIQQGYTSDAQLVLLAELQRDVDDAEAARQRRAAATAASGVAVLSLARVAQAARLGFITPAAYQARLQRDGYTPDDIAIEMELLIVEIADTQAARARRETLAAEADAPKAISLGQLERAVKAGVSSINSYRAAAAELYGIDDVELLVATLQSELDGLNEARARRTSIEGELTARTLSLGQLEAGVKLGAVSLADYHAQLIEWGYGSDDADLLSALLFEQLSKAGAG